MSRPFALSEQEEKIIHALRRNGSLSRTEIARLTGWSRAKVSNQVKRLIHARLLTQVGEGDSIGGRRPGLVAINKNRGYVVGVDIGATSVDLALADLGAKTIQRSSAAADVREEPQVLLTEIVKRVLDLLELQDVDPKHILGIGVGVPGPVDFSHGVLVAPPLMPAWEGFPIREHFCSTFPHARVVVDNDVNIMALGEFYAGAGRGVDNFIYVKIGTGIGAGIVSDGKIHRGSSGSAGDIGHICVDRNGPICRCGNSGCLEAMAAGPAIAARAMEAARSGGSPILAKRLEANNGVLRSEDVSIAASEGDRAAIEIIQTSGGWIGDVLAGLVNFFNPHLILIGGGVSNVGNQLLASIRQAVLHRSTALATRNLIVNYSPMGTEAAVTGAIHLALESLFVVQDRTT